MTIAIQHARSPAAGRARNLWRAHAALLFVLAIVTGCGGTVAPADAPPAGTIWFGQSFDPKTFKVTGQTTTIGSGQPFVMVGNVGRSVKPAELTIRVTYNGEVVGTQPVQASGEGEIWGFPISPLGVAGEWKYELVDVGGNVLASGTIQST